MTSPTHAPNEFGFHSVHHLRSGAGARTIRSVLHGRQVVLRRLSLSRVDAGFSDRVARDLAVAERCGSTHLLPCRMLRVDAGGVTLVRPYVEGTDMRGWARTGPDDEAIRCAAQELFDGLRMLHCYGLVHGGVKPANTILDRTTGQLVLVDAIVSRTQLGSSEVAHDEADTRYLSPEQAGAVHRVVGPAADLYAAGWTVLDTIAVRAGRSLRTPDPCAVQAPLDPVLHDLGIPYCWRPLLRRLLAPMPEDRFGTAEEVLDALATAAESGRSSLARSRLSDIGASEPGDDRASDEAPAVLGNPPLVGRAPERALLAGVLDAVRSGRPVAACLSGHSGLGKSRLLDELAERADSVDVWVLRGSAFDETARRPLALFREVFGRAAVRLGEDPDRAARLAAGLGTALPAVLALAPELTAALAGTAGRSRGSRAVPASLAEETGGGAVVALAGLLHDLAEPHRPGLLVVDDCQWADELSWKLLSALIGATGRRSDTRSHFAVVLSMRTEALAEVLSWEADELEIVRLDPMASHETQVLLDAAGDRLPPPVSDYVVTRAAGNPLFALSTLQALWDTAALRGARGRWTFDAARMRELPEFGTEGLAGHGQSDDDPPSAFLAARMEQLSAPAHRALHQAAVLGRRFSVPLLAAALARDLSATWDDVAEAADRGLLQPVPGGPADEREFSHDRVREAVLRGIYDDSSADLHAAAAGALADLGDEAARSGYPSAVAGVVGIDYELAYHLDRSGQHDRALPHALTAAEQALRHNSLDVAEANFRIAASGLAGPPAEADRRARFRLHEGMGTVHMLQGRYERAAAELELAYRIARDLGRLEPARVAVSLAELAFKRGDVIEARTWFGHAQHRLVHSDLRRLAPARATFELIRLGLILLVRLPARRQRRGDSVPDPRLELAARLDNRFGYLSWFTARPSVNVALCARAMRLSVSSGSIRELSYACALTAAILAGLFPALSHCALRLVDYSLRLRAGAGDDWGEAHSRHFQGFVLHAARRYPEAVAALDAAINRFAVLGDRWEHAAANWQKALCLYRRGLLHEAGALARETYGAGNRIGDRISAGTALAIWARCLPFEVDVDTIDRELRRSALDGHTETLLRTALGWKLLTDGDLDGAVDQLAAADCCRRQAGLRNHFLAPTATTLAQALRLRRDCEWPRGRSGRIRQSVRRSLRRAWFSSLWYPAERTSVLRERATWRFENGPRRYANRLLARARNEALRWSADGELAACQWLAEQAGIESCGARSATGSAAEPNTEGSHFDEMCGRLRLRVNDGLVQARSLPVARSVADAARHRAVLEAARRIVAAEGIDQILDELRVAVLTTTPAVEAVVSASVADSMSGAPPREAAGDRSRTESVIRSVAGGRTGRLAVRAELPLGEAAGHEQSIDVLATLAGAVLERQSLREESARRITAVQEAERGRIARDLHDELGHLFVAVLEGLTVLDRVDSHPGNDHVRGLRELARHGMRTVRSVAWTLRPEGLDDLGVVACVEQLVDDCARRFGLEIDLTAQVDRSIPPAVETAVFRVVQEALTNIGRHSSATEASVLLVAGHRRLRVVVEDDGVGFDPDAPRSGSLGLAGMRERAALVGGRLEVQARPGAGVLVMVEVPLDDERPDSPQRPSDQTGYAQYGARPQHDEQPWPGCDERCRGL
jgi:two-component system sensor kinase